MFGRGDGEGCVTAHTQHRRGGSQPPVSERCCLCAVCAPAACIPTACITASRQELSPSHLNWVVLGVTLAEAERSCSVKNISGFEVWNWGNGVRKWAGVLVCLLFFFYLHLLSWQSLFCKPSASLHHPWPQHWGGGVWWKTEALAPGLWHYAGCAVCMVWRRRTSPFRDGSSVWALLSALRLPGR